MKEHRRARHSAGVAFALALASSGLAIPLALSAHAAEIPVKAQAYEAPLAVPPYNWSGFYVGGNFGGAWSNNLPIIAGVPWDPGSTRFLGGVEHQLHFAVAVVCRKNVETLVYGRANHLLRCGLSCDQRVDAAPELRFDTQKKRRCALGVEIPQQHAKIL